MPLPQGPLLDAASWEQTPLVARQLVIHLLASIRQQDERIRTLEARIAALEARLRRRSSNADRPPSSDPPYEKRTAPSGMQGRPGASPGHRQALLAPTEIIEVMPEICARGQQEFPATTPYYTHQVIELLQIEMSVAHVVLHEVRCPRRGRILKADLPGQYRYGYGPRLTARIGELSGRQRDSRGAVQAFCTSVLGVPINTPLVPWVPPRRKSALRSKMSY
jgi:transposase